MRQERRRYARKEAWVSNQGNRTTHNAQGLIANITRCLRKTEATWEDAFTIGLRDTNKSPSSNQRRRQIDKAASLCWLRSRQLTEWHREEPSAIHVSGTWTCAALFAASRLACDVRNQKLKITCGDAKSNSM